MSVHGFNVQTPDGKTRHFLFAHAAKEAAKVLFEQGAKWAITIDCDSGRVIKKYGDPDETPGIARRHSREPEEEDGKMRTVREVFEQFILGRDELVLTVKSKDGASVNMDGPFEFATFTFHKQEGPKKQVVQERVVQPKGTPKRGGESVAHCHVPWEQVAAVRIEYMGKGELPIPHDIRISFYSSIPPDNERGSELLWFYGYQSKAEEICKILPQVEGSRYSKAMVLSRDPAIGT